MKRKIPIKKTIAMTPTIMITIVVARTPV